MTRRAELVLEDGTVCRGTPFGAPVNASGEVVFNTGMVGYPETLTDPSYRGQIIVLTWPIVGNYGVPAPERDRFGLPARFESDRIHAAGLVVSDYCARHSHHTAVKSLHDWLAEQGVPGLYGVDTRMITRRLRAKGTMLGAIVQEGEAAPRLQDPNASHLVAAVSPREARRLRPEGKGPFPVVALLDCGCKASIYRNLLQRGIEVLAVPHDYYLAEADFDGVLLSNGPGDPRMCGAAVRHIQQAMALNKPMFGICLGSQLLALAAGADTYKLKFGHRGQNQPCIEAGGGRCLLTSQNHGYAVDASTLPPDWEVWFTNANDGTVEGVRHRSRPYFGVQFHPEASPGPTDASVLFDEFARAVRRAAGMEETGEAER